jgi:hypothetical protein
MHGSEIICYCGKLFFFPDKKERCSFHKIPDFSCSRFVKRVIIVHLFGNAQICALCKHCFRVQLLQSPPLCSSTSKTLKKFYFKIFFLQVVTNFSANIQVAGDEYNNQIGLFHRKQSFKCDRGRSHLTVWHSRLTMGKSHLTVWQSHVKGDAVF